jgi:hypothetical protein
MDSGSYRIAMSIQWLFALVLGTGLFLLPESPRWYVKRGRHEDAARSLSTLRGQPVDSQYVKDELNELVENYKYEMTHMQAGWADCFTGGWNPAGNLRRVMLGVALQMFQQWTGVNFVFVSLSSFLILAGHADPELVLRLYLLQDRRSEERVPDFHDHHCRQRWLHAHLLLDH